MRFDVAIVGASLAGSCAALLLGRAGLRVALIDKAFFPRRKPCGEGLSRTGIEVFKRLGLERGLCALPQLSYHGFEVLSAGRSANISAPFGAGITIQRSRLDAFLREQALLNSSVSAFEGCEVRELSGSSSLKIGAEELSANYILAADGSSSRVAALAGCRSAQHSAARQAATVTYTGRFDAPQRLVRIFIEPEFEVYCTPLAEGRLNVSILASARSPINLRTQLLEPALTRKLFEHIGFVGELELPPLGRTGITGTRRSGGPNSMYCLGDAAEEFDPIGGMGMSHALRCGEFSAQSILAAEARTKTPAEARASYEKSREAVAKTYRRFTRLCFHTLSASRHYPPLLRVAASPAGELITRAMVLL